MLYQIKVHTKQLRKLIKNAEIWQGKKHQRPSKKPDNDVVWLKHAHAHPRDRLQLPAPQNVDFYKMLIFPLDIH